MKTLQIFVLPYIKGVTVGLIGIACIHSIVWERFQTEQIYAFITMMFLNCLLCFLFTMLVLLPLSHFEKQRITEKSAVELFKRYLPGIVVVPSVLFLILFFNYLHQVPEEQEIREFYGFFIADVAFLGQCAAALWTFLKEFKNQIHDIDNENNLANPI